MRTLVTITDVTRMRGTNVCIAGYSQDGRCIRPVLRRGAIQEDWLLEKGQIVIRPFAIVEFDLLKNDPDPPHTEDWIINSTYRVCRGMLTSQQQRELLREKTDDAVENIFGALVHSKPGRYVKAGEGDRSLGTVQPKVFARVEFVKDRGTYQILFKDQAEEWWKLTVVDLSFRQYTRFLCVAKGKDPDEVAKSLTQSLRRRYIFLRIGLSRGWTEYPDRCFLQVTGVYSFPDYLEGRCFADFALSG
jgi:hypothetical protein